MAEKPVKGVFHYVAGAAEPFERARLLYERADFDGDAGALVAADRVL